MENRGNSTTCPDPLCGLFTHGAGVWSLGQDGRRAYVELGICGGSHAD